jgi:non-canonical poly(A) RNA polymerase PAPD5/7
MQNQFVNQNNIQNIPIEIIQNQQMLFYPHQNNQYFSNQMQIPQMIAQDNLKAKNIYLKNIIESYQINEIKKFAQENKQTPLIQTGILMILQKYEKNILFYDLLNIFLACGGDIDAPIYYEKRPFKIEEKEKITLLMFGIMFNDINLVNLVLKYNPNLNKVDYLKRNAIIYSIIYDNKDNSEIISLLINKGADINSTINLEMAPEIFELHSVFTLACFKGLVNIVKVLLENNVNYRFVTQPNGDNGLHLSTQYNHIETANLLIHNTNGMFDQINKGGFKPFDIARIKNNDVYKLFLSYNQAQNNYQINIDNNNIYNTFNNVNEENSNHSSDYGETMEGTDKDTFTNSSMINQSINVNQGQINLNNYDMNKNNNFIMNQNLFLKKNMNQIPLMGINNNLILENNDMKVNLNQQDEYNEKGLDKLTEKDLEILRNKLSSSITKKISYNHNLQIPIEFVKNNSNNFNNTKEYNLNNFIKISKPPTLCLDLNDKSYELEIKLRELKEELNEKLQKMKDYEEKISDSDKKLNILQTKLEEKNIELNLLKNSKNENLIKINEYTQQKEELLSKIPEDKIEQSNKNIPLKKYRLLKFQTEKYDENFIIKSLQKDLLDYEKYIKEQVSKMKKIIEQLITNIKMTINEKSKDFEVKICGSYANELSLPWSDLNVVLINKNPSINSLQNNQIFLGQLSYILKTKTWVHSFKFIENSSIPKIKLNTFTEFGMIQVEITIQDEKNNKINSVNLINSYLKEYKVLQPIILALKTILKNANLNNPETGGLSSYGLILMIVSYIQSQSENNNYKEDEENIIGKIFYDFLGHYGIYFDFNKYVILTYPIKNSDETLIDKNSTFNLSSNSHELIIVDPLNNQNNVAKNTSQFMNLKMAFMIAFMVTKEDCECGCHYGKAQYEYSIKSTEHCFLKRMFNSVKRFSNNK